MIKEMKYNDKINLICLECGYKFKRSSSGIKYTSTIMCPKCKGYDIEVDN